MKKILLYMRLNVMYMFRNKVRFLLTTFGISLGLFIYIIGNTTIVGYINSLYKKAYEFDKDSILVYDKEDEIIDRIQDYSDNLYVSKCNFVIESYVTDISYKYKNTKINNSIKLIGLNNGISNTSIPYDNDEYIALAKGKILYGNDFSSDELKNGTNSIVIEKSSAIYLFQKEDAVGEYIDIISPNGYNRFKIIGVIEDLPSSYSNNLKFNKTVEQNSENEYSNTLNVYTTYNYLKSMTEKSSIQERYVVNVNTNELNKDIHEIIADINKEAIAYCMDVNIISQNSLIEQVYDLECKMKGLVNAIVGLIIILSGFMIVTIFIFSIKERTYEIGVRRAVGASKFDIIVHFIVEGIITAIVAGITTLFISVIVCNFVTSYLIAELYIDIRLIMTREIIISMLGLAILQGMLFSFIPALVATKIHPTEAIRWD